MMPAADVKGLKLVQTQRAHIPSYSWIENRSPDTPHILLKLAVRKFARTRTLATLRHRLQIMADFQIVTKL
jgi:hypothetical protein